MTMTTRPKTCDGPIMEITSTANAVATPSSSSIVSRCVMMTMWLPWKSEKLNASSHTAGRRRLAQKPPDGFSFAPPAWTSIGAAPTKKIGAQANDMAANVRTATRQSYALATALATGKESGPAKPAQSETLTIARLAGGPPAASRCNK